MRGATFEGEPCTKCGSTERYEVSGQCRKCKIRIATARNRALGPDRNRKRKPKFWET